MPGHPAAVDDARKHRVQPVLVVEQRGLVDVAIAPYRRWHAPAHQQAMIALGVTGHQRGVVLREDMRTGGKFVDRAHFHDQQVRCLSSNQRMLGRLHGQRGCQAARLADVHNAARALLAAGLVQAHLPLDHDIQPGVEPAGGVEDIARDHSRRLALRCKLGDFFVAEPAKQFQAGQLARFRRYGHDGADHLRRFLAEGLLDGEVEIDLGQIHDLLVVR